MARLTLYKTLCIASQLQIRFNYDVLMKDTIDKFGLNSLYIVFS